MQPPDGPPVCTALNSPPSTMPPPMSNTMSRSEMPIGTSTSPEFTTRPARANTLVPLLSAVPIDAYQAAPLRMMGAMLANVSTLLISVGWPHKPDTAGYGGRGRGVPRWPSNAGDQRRLLAAHEGAGADADVDVEAERRLGDVGAEQVVPFGLADGALQSLDGERIFGSNVDVPWCAPTA